MARVYPLNRPGSDGQVSATQIGLHASWGVVQSFVDRWGPQRSGTMAAQAAMLSSLRHGNGSWLPRR